MDDDRADAARAEDPRAEQVGEAGNAGAGDRVAPAGGLGEEGGAGDRGDGGGGGVGGEGVTGAHDGEQRADPGDIDARFAAIVARWSDEAWPHQAPADGARADDTTREDDAALPQPGSSSGPTRGSDADAVDGGDAEAGWRGYVPAEVEEHFEPPEPRLPPAHDATYWLALAGLVCGPLVVLWAAVFSGNPDPGWWVLLGVCATVVGFGLLVVRGSGDRDPDDDGARV